MAKGSAEGKEDLKAYVDEQVAALRSEMRTLLADRHKHSNEVALDIKNEAADVPLCAKHLDQQGAHELGRSIWDCTVMVGLDCLGPGESCLVILLIALNFLMQLYFCYVVLLGSDMLEDPVSADVLHALLRYRTGVAHRVENANLVSRQSLLRQICERDQRLHISGTQRGLYEDLTSFQQGGWLLCVLALLCWSAKALAESGATLRFGQAVLELRGESTRVVMQAQGGMAFESLSPRDVAKVFLIGVLPRLAMALLLFYTGTLYLSRTSRLEDLLLNAMALAFVLDVDEVLFEAFAPHRVKNLLTGLAPLPLKPGAARRPWLGLCPAVLRLFGVAAVLLLVHELELRPLHVRLQQALHILCSGERDFVYGLSPATGVVVAARSAPDDVGWPAAECAVLQLARPQLHEAKDFGWSPQTGQCSFLEESDGPPAQIRPAQIRPNGVATLEQVPFSPAEFDFVSSLAKADIEEAGLQEICMDVTSSSPVGLMGLREIVGHDGSCEDARSLCHLANMSRVRSLCGVMCECYFTGWSASGFYKSTRHGCPAACLGLASALKDANTAEGGSPFKCKDMQPFQERNTSELLLFLDSDQDGRIHWFELDLAYLRHEIDNAFRTHLWLFDLDGDLTWNTSEQGAFQEVSELYERLDGDLDGNLSQAELQGEPLDFRTLDVDGNGLLTRAELARGDAPQEAPWHLTHLTRDMRSGIKLYMGGLFEFLRSQSNFRSSLQQTLPRLRSLENLSHSDIVEHFLDGAEADWASGVWVLAPGVGHPRGLQSCEFLLSFELQLLLGVDLCNPQGLASLRTVCPETCLCQPGMEDCPSSCTDVTVDDKGS